MLVRYLDEKSSQREWERWHNKVRALVGDDELLGEHTDLFEYLDPDELDQAHLLGGWNRRLTCRESAVHFESRFESVAASTHFRPVTQSSSRRSDGMSLVTQRISNLTGPIMQLYYDIMYARISILALARSQCTPALPRIRRLSALNPAHHLRRQAPKPVRPLTDVDGAG